MRGRETTIEVALNEEHTSVAVIIDQKIAAYDPYDALKISAHILDSTVGLSDNESTPILFEGLPRIGTTAADARTIAVTIATCADRVLVEADFEF